MPFPDLPAVPGFSLPTAGTLAWAAQAAYEVQDQAKVSKILDGWNWTLVRAFDVPASGAWFRAGAKGFVARAGAATVIAFAGTEPEDIKTWLEDFDFTRDRDGAHEGFLGGAKAGAAEIAAALGTAPGPVYLTGHSLGAAIAAMAAMLMVTADPLGSGIVGVYTIGMPRPGDSRYAGTYNPRLGTRTFRLVHGGDLVTKVPPSLMGFRHVGAVLACPRGGIFSGQPAVPPDEGASLRETGEIAAAALAPFRGNDAPAYPSDKQAAVSAAALLSPPIRDHLPDGYLRALGVLA